MFSGMVKKTVHTQRKIPKSIPPMKCKIRASTANPFKATVTRVSTDVYRHYTNTQIREKQGWPERRGSQRQSNNLFPFQTHTQDRADEDSGGSLPKQPIIFGEILSCLETEVN
jgi:hypothetical protein